MRLPREWKNWQVFLVSVFLALVITPLVAPLYSDVFTYSRGGFFIDDELLDKLETYLYSFLFLYAFFLSFFTLDFVKHLHRQLLLIFLFYRLCSLC
ncbi:hypothetical protein A2116_01060 [Candidatus Jorgensenbacteria bacterium GWA1_49_17]|uniref:Uncharacterized protein n=1 Tax=Candidatus Jorgensenbacteria bacterium GWA1_49_17 TaxID=1798467 RepID=A0A1F6BU48_9BACT|nr:MAG: hypothetical protein A2116_01060 [Candidatus Jorgensenbacteria bacterium GWA1_49_17]